MSSHLRHGSIAGEPSSDLQARVILARGSRSSTAGGLQQEKVALRIFCNKEAMQPCDRVT